MFKLTYSVVVVLIDSIAVAIVGIQSIPFIVGCKVSIITGSGIEGDGTAGDISSGSHLLGC